MTNVFKGKKQFPENQSNNNIFSISFKSGWYMQELPAPA